MESNYGYQLIKIRREKSDKEEKEYQLRNTIMQIIFKVEIEMDFNPKLEEISLEFECVKNEENKQLMQSWI